MIAAAGFALLSCGGSGDDGDGDAAKVESASPLETDFRLSGAEPVDIDALFALIWDQGGATYDKAEFDSRLGATVVTNLRFADADDGEHVLVERAEFYGVDLDAVRRVQEAPGAPDAPFDALFEKVRLLNVTAEGFEDSEGSLSIGGVEFDDFSMRRGGVAEGQGGDEGARLFNAIRLGGLYVKDAAFSVTGEQTGSVLLNVPDLRIVGLGEGELSAVIANDLEYQFAQMGASLSALNESIGSGAAFLLDGPLSSFIAPNNQRTRVRALEWRNIDLSGLLEWGLKGETPPETARELIDLGTMKISGAESFIDERRVSSIEEMTVSSAKFTWLIPSNFRADTKGAVTDFTAYVPETETATIELMKSHSLDKVPSEGYVEWIWNEGAGAADFNYVADAEGFANLSMAVGVSGLKLSELQAARENGDEDAFARLAQFRNMALKVADENALDAVFALTAFQSGGSAEQLRQGAPAMIRLMGAQFALSNPRFGEYVDALAAFVAEGGALEIIAEPAEPVSLATLQESVGAPQNLPDALNLTVTHTK
jgi:hypothetical protein